MQRKRLKNINHEQHNDPHLQHEHPAVVLIVPQELVHLIQCFQFLINGAVPVGQVESAAQALVDSCQVPIAKKLADVE